MKSCTATRFRTQLYKLLDEVSTDHKPIHIQGKRTSAVLVDANDWQAIQETLYLLSIPDLKDKILDSRNQNHAKMTKAKDLKW